MNGHFEIHSNGHLIHRDLSHPLDSKPSYQEILDVNMSEVNQDTVTTAFGEPLSVEEQFYNPTLGTPHEAPKVEEPKGFSAKHIHIDHIPLDHIFSDNTFNNRGKLVLGDYMDLAKAIAKQGLLQPITIQPWFDAKHPTIKYRIVMGHCRYAACKYLKWPSIPAIIREFTEDEAFYANVEENLTRVQLNLKQESKLVQIMFRKGMTADEICKKLDKPSQWVRIRERFIHMPEKIQDECLVHQFSAKQLNQLVSLVSVPRQYTLLRQMKEKKERAENDIAEEYTELAVEFEKRMREKRYRKASEIAQLRDKIYDVFGPCDATLVLAWACGALSSNDLWDTLQQSAVDVGLTIQRPLDTRDLSVRSDI